MCALYGTQFISAQPRSLLVRSIDFWKESSSWGQERERERKDLACVVYMSVLCSDDQCLAIIWKNLTYIPCSPLWLPPPPSFLSIPLQYGESTFVHSTATKTREKLNSTNGERERRVFEITFRSRGSLVEGCRNQWSRSSSLSFLLVFSFVFCFCSDVCDANQSKSIANSLCLQLPFFLWGGGYFFYFVVDKRQDARRRQVNIGV